MKKVMKNSWPRAIPLWLGLLMGVLIGLGPRGAAADPALRYQRTSNRIDRRDVRSSNRIEHRDMRVTNRINRRDYILSPPVGAARVAVGGVHYYRAGAVYYKPEFYQGRTVYVQVDIN